MTKPKAAIIIVVMGILGNLLLTITGPMIADIAFTANQTMAASSNMSNYPGTSSLMVASPWVLYLMFNFVVLIVLVITLKFGQARPSA